MKVLITGGMGVMGAEASRKFVQEGFRPIVLGRHRNEHLIRDIVDKVDIELGDVTDLVWLLHVIKKHKVTHIVHAAGMVSAGCAATPPLGVQANVIGTINVLEAARLFDVTRVVFTSAKGVYGPFLGEYGDPIYRLVSEDHPKNPSSMYGMTKLMAEHACLFYQENFGVDVVALRFATNYGPGKASRGAHGVMGRIIEDPVHGQPFCLPKGGDQKDDFIYNKDSALGIFLACTATNLQSRVFNIGTGVGVSLKDFARAVRRYLPNAQIEVGPGPDFLGKAHMYSIFDISRAKKELGYKPQFDLDRAVGDYLESLKAISL